MVLFGFCSLSELEDNFSFCFQENLRSWLLDPDCNDQYSVIHGGGDKVAIMWNTPQEPILSKERTVCCHDFFNIIVTRTSCKFNKVTYTTYNTSYAVKLLMPPVILRLTLFTLHVLTKQYNHYFCYLQY